jgi:hypothetical protein
VPAPKFPKSRRSRFSRFDRLLMAKLNRFSVRYSFAEGPGTRKTSNHSAGPLKSTLHRNGNFREKIIPYKEVRDGSNSKLNFEAKTAHFS